MNFYLPYQNLPDIISLKNKAREHGFPLYGTFELTARCNFDCKMCYVHNQESNSLANLELSTEQWKSLMDDAIASGMMFALLTGGECLLRKDFKELYLYLTSKGVIVSVNTNGALIDEEYVRFFQTNKPERLQISLYGSNDDTYEQITGRRRFDAVLSAIRMLRDAGVNVEIAITPTKYLKEDAEALYSLLKEEKLRFQVSNVLISSRDGETTEELTEEDRIEMSVVKAQVFGKSVSIPDCAPPVPCGQCTEAVFGMPCNAGTIRFFLSWDGKMQPCVSIPEVSVDVRDFGFMESWQFIHKKMTEVKRPVECPQCPYETVCGLCPVSRYDGLFSGHCNKERCHYMVKSFRRGLFKLKDGIVKSI